MKAKIVGGQLVAVMTHREGAFLSALLANSLPTGTVNEVYDVGSCLWAIYDYPEDEFMKPFGFAPTAGAVLDAHMEQLNIAEEHYA